MSRLRYMVPMVTGVLLAALVTACPRSEPQPEVDYIVPKVVDAIVVCQHLLSGKRAADEPCDDNTDGYRWMYDLREGHSELPAVGERVYSIEFSATRPPGVVERIPERGGWWK